MKIHIQGVALTIAYGTTAGSPTQNETIKRNMLSFRKTIC